MAAKQGQTRKAGRQRVALIAFAALFVAFFVGFAVAQGIGQPSVPSGAVALVQSAPEGTVTEAEFKRSLVQQIAAGGLKKPPKPGEKKYEELKTAALKEILQPVWIRGEAEELGIQVSHKAVVTELAKIKKTNFKAKGSFEAFLKKSHFTPADVVNRIELQLLIKKIQEVIAKQAPPVSESEIAAFYDSAKATQYTTPETRDVRIVVGKNKANVEKAKAALEKDDSPASWKKVAAKYSEDPTTKTKGGLQPGLSEELLKGKGSIESAIFKSPTGKVVGLVNYENNYFVVEVEKLNPSKVKTLEEVKGEISTQLGQQASEAASNEFIGDFQSKWQSRTFCASGFVIEMCSNYVAPGRPANAPPGCFEANPKGGPPKECPAPVALAEPALPGTTTILKPTGERFPQRPHPEVAEEAGAEGASPEGVAPGATGAPPGATAAPPASGE